MAKEIQTLQNQEKSAPTLLPGGFSEAMDSFAKTPTLIGELSTRVMQSAAQEEAMQKGYEMGETPRGDLGPAITDYDKTLISAYKSRSQAVLGNQAQQVLNQGQELVAKSKLSQENINSYTSNSAQAIEDILQHAPTGVKQNLQAQFDSSLNNSVHQMNLKLNNQIKAENEQSYSQYTTTALDGIHSSAILGNEEATKKSVDDYEIYNKASLDAGTITQKTYKANQDAIKLTKDSGESIRKAIQARNEGKLNQFMASFSNLDNKPADISLSEWEMVAKNTGDYMRKLISYKNAQDEQTSLELQMLANDGKLTGSELIAKTSGMETNNAEKTILQVQKIHAKQQQASNTTSLILKNKDNASELAKYTPKEIDAAHAQLTQSFMDAASKAGTPINKDEAELKAALSLNTPVKSYVDRLNHGILFGSAQDAHRISVANKVFKSQNKGTLLPISKEASAKLANYDLLVDAGAVGPNEAYQKATELSQIDETVRKTRNIAWESESKSSLNDSNAQIKKGRELIGLSNHWFGWFDTPLANQDVMIRQALTLYKENFMLTGSLAAAEKATHDAMSVKVAETTINGPAEVAFMPLERQMDLGADGNADIWSDAKEHISQSLDAMKEQYDNKQLNYYYEISPDNDSIPPEITKRFRGGGEQKFKLRMDAMMGESTVRGANYQLSLQNEMAQGLPFDMLPDAKNGFFIYRPNQENINKNFELSERVRRKEPEKVVSRIKMHDHFNFTPPAHITTHGHGRFNINTGKS